MQKKNSFKLQIKYLKYANENKLKTVQYSFLDQKLLRENQYVILLDSTLLFNIHNIITIYNKALSLFFGMVKRNCSEFNYPFTFK